LSTNLKEEHNNDIFDEGIISDNSTDDFYSIYSDGKLSSDFENDHIHFQSGESVVKEKMTCNETTEREKGKRGSNENEKCDGREGICIRNCEKSKGEHIERERISKEDRTNGSNSFQVAVDQDERLKEEKKGYIHSYTGEELPCNSGHYRYNFGDDGDKVYTNEVPKLKQMHDSTNEYRKGKSKKGKCIGERSKNYSICNGVIRECYKQIILNDFLHHLYDVVHTKNEEIIRGKYVQKREQINYDPHFPTYKNKINRSPINNKFVDFFFNNFRAYNVKNRNFFHQKKASTNRVYISTKRNDITNDKEENIDSQCGRNDSDRRDDRDNRESALMPLYVYLHVIDYNKAAINLYNKLNFDYIYTYDNFYDINKMTFSAYFLNLKYGETYGALKAFTNASQGFGSNCEEALSLSRHLRMSLYLHLD
ncbi:asparagine-rich antigen, partial [Plasmodium ovale curtisi]